MSSKWSIRLNIRAKILNTLFILTVHATYPAHFVLKLFISCPFFFILSPRSRVLQS
jgi:hypothetical protein